MKSIGGFYYVRADGEDYECKARGSFRKSGNSPVAGDRVNISVPNDGFCAIEEILPRKNKLRRPALANLDILLLVCSTVEPLPNFTIIDKMTAAAVNNNMEPVIVVTKNDLENGDKIADIYRHAGFEVFLCSEDDSSQTEELKSYLSGKVSAFIGNSGVGKSTLLNKGRQVKNSAEEDIQQELLNCLNLTVVLWLTHPDFQPLIFSVTK